MKVNIEQIFKAIAMRENRSIEEIKTDIQLSMLEGLNNPDPNIRARWAEIPCVGEVPTPEELIAWAVDKVISGANF